jgi:signal transduction histidine kinase
MEQLRRLLGFHRDLGLQLLALYLFLIVPFLAALWGFDRLLGERIRSDVESNDLSLARAIAQETELTISNGLKAVEELTRYPGIIQADHTEMESHFGVVYDTRPDVNLVYRLDYDGIMLYHYPPGPSTTVGIDFSFRDYFQRAKNTEFPLVSKGRISPTTNQAVATAVMPIWSTGGEFLGLVGTNITLESLSVTLVEIVSEQQPEKDFQIFIIDASGQIVASPYSELLLQPTNNFLPDIYSYIPEDENGSFTASVPEGEERLYTYTPISGIGWGVIVSRPTVSAFATQIFLHRIVLVTAGTFILIGLFFWGMLSWRVIRPIERLAPVSKAIGLNQPISIEEREVIETQSRRLDQIGRLTRSIIRLEEAIADRMDEQAVLLETSTAVVSSLETQIVLNRILDQAHRLLNVRMSAIIALDEKQGAFRIRANRGLSRKFVEQLTIQPSEPGSVTMRALHSREPIQVSDTETDPSYKYQRPRARAEGYRSILAVPLNTQHAPPTSLLVFHPHPHTFSHNEIQLLSNLANQATMAIENAVLYERSDMRLKEQTRRLEALIQSMHDGLILSNLSGTVIYANKRIGELADLAQEELPGAPIDQVLIRIVSKSPDAEKFSVEIQKLLGFDNDRRLDIPLLVLGRSMYLRLETFDVTDVQNIPIGHGLILQDITADYELDRMKSSLVSTVSHELRTPLAAIKGYATTLLAEDVEWDRSSQQEFISIISNETDRLTNLVNNLLDLSRIEAGSLNLSLDECDIQDLLHRASRQAQLNNENGFEIQVEAGMPTLYADRPRLETILRNLIENSVKYAGSSASIRVDVSHENGSVVFKVSDNGPGIPKKEDQRIFESFYRIDDSLTRIASGAGLGLAICQGLVHAHGGAIWVEPQERGACVAFSIPLVASPFDKEAT